MKWSPVAQVVGVRREPGPEALHLQGPGQALDHPLPWGSRTNAASSSMSSRPSEHRKWGERWTSSFVAELHASGEGPPEATEPVDDGVGFGRAAR